MEPRVPCVDGGGDGLELRAARRHRREGGRIHVLDAQILEPQRQRSNPFRYPSLTFFYPCLLVFFVLYFFF
jgi:activating molecule in BECN1-regulated autophagy protein 1